MYYFPWRWRMENKLIIIYLITLRLSVRHRTLSCVTDFGEINHEQASIGRLCLHGSFPDFIPGTINGLQVIHLTDPATFKVKFCHVLVILSNITFDEYCPGYCNPIPAINISVTKIDNILNLRSKDITCSLSVDMLDTKFKSTSREDELSLLFESIYYRRILECKEPKLWSTSIPKNYLQKREIDGLFVWVGSSADKNMLLLQRSVLFDNINIVENIDNLNIGWLATEDPYSCSQESSFCPYREANHRYNPYLSTTGITLSLSLF